MYLKKKVATYLEELAKRTPSPGGGSASGLNAALGAALNLMVIRHSVPGGVPIQRDKFLSHLEKKQKKILSELEILVDEDCRAYTKLRKALAKKGNIQEAFKGAAMPPINISHASLLTMETTLALLKKHNKRLVTDLGCAAYMSYAAFYSAKLNVQVNLLCISDNSFVSKYNSDLARSQKKIDSAFKKVTTFVNAQVKGA